MSNDLNQCNFIGRLGADPEVRYLTNGDAVASFRIAVGWKGKDKEGAEWVSVSAFGKLAEICGQWLKKGSQVFISGRMKTDEYEKDGVKRYSTKIIADRMQMLGGKTQEQTSSTQGPRPHAAPTTSSFSDMSDDIPFLFNMNTVCDTLGQPKSLWRAKYGKEMSLMLANQTVC